MIMFFLSKLKKINRGLHLSSQYSYRRDCKIEIGETEGLSSVRWSRAYERIHVSVSAPSRLHKYQNKNHFNNSEIITGI